MTVSATDIDAIVREVMRRLAETDGDSSAPSSAESTRRLDLPLVSMSDVEGKLTGIGVLVVRSRTIVTPLVRDYLKDTNVTLRREAAE